MDAAKVDRLRELEESLWRPTTRFDRAHLERVLHPEFTEVGASGRTYTRADILGTPERSFETALPLPGFDAHVLADDVVLLTYVATVEDGAHSVTAHRSSVWLRTEAGWQLRFHQGTPAPHPEENVF